MTSHKPPPRKPQPAAQPQRPQPYQQPMGQQPQPYEPAEPASGSPVVTIVLIVLAVVIGVPVLACGGVVLFSFLSVRQVALSHQEAREQAAEAERRLEEQEQARLELALKAQLKPVLFEKSKDAIKKHWTEPAGIRRRVWSAWQVRKVGDNRWECYGQLKLGPPTVTHQWVCEFASADPNNPRAEWELKKVVVDMQKFYP